MPSVGRVCCNDDMSGNTDIHNDRPDDRWTDRFFRMCRESYLVRPDDRWIGGVCGAIARRMGWSTALVRALMLLCVFLFGAGAAFYGFAWFVLPDSRGAIIAEDILDGRWQGSMVGIIICWLLAAWALGIGVASIIIAALVLYFFIRWSRQQARNHFHAAGPAGPGPYAGPGPGPQGYGPYGPGSFSSGPSGQGSFGPVGGAGSGPYNPGPSGPAGPAPHDPGPYGPAGPAPFVSGSPDTGSAGNSPYDSAGGNPYAAGLTDPGAYDTDRQGDGSSGSRLPDASTSGRTESAIGSQAEAVGGSWSSDSDGSGAFNQGPPGGLSGENETDDPGAAAGPTMAADGFGSGRYGYEYGDSGQPVYGYPLQPPSTPKPHRLRRRPAGPGLVCLLLGLILLSGGAVWLLASIHHGGILDALRYALVWAAAVALILGLVIIVLGCLGRRSGGLTPMAIAAAIAVLVLACCSIAFGNAQFEIRSNLRSYASVGVNGKNEGKRLGSTKRDMERYRKGLLLIGDSDDQGRAVIDLSEFEQNNGTHKVDMTDSVRRVSGCPTGTIRLALRHADVRIILPTGCTYAYSVANSDPMRWSTSYGYGPSTRGEEDWAADDGDVHMPDSPELSVQVEPAISGRVSFEEKGTATLPERRTDSGKKHGHLDNDNDSYEGREDEDYE